MNHQTHQSKKNLLEILITKYPIHSLCFVQYERIIESKFKGIRRVTVLDPNQPRDFMQNKIKTSKYTVLNFLPKNLVTQFTKFSNICFLIIAVLQVVKPISISGGVPTELLPLGFVILVSMVKDIFEDWQRHKSDRQENNQQVLTYDVPTKDFKLTYWHQLKVGQIVKV